MALERTDFEVREHGFHFWNYFDFSLEFELPLVGAIDLGEIVYGLCGGMCFAALDYFHAKVLPALDTVIDDGSALYDYLLLRQLRSLAAPVVPLKILEWMIRDDLDVARRTASREFPKIRRRIAKGNPAVLLLIRAGGFSDPTQNHQVVATGYDLDEATQDVKIFLYDPNHPDEEPTLDMNLADPKHGIDLKQSTGEHLRGFFVLDYRPRKRGLPLPDVDPVPSPGGTPT